MTVQVCLAPLADLDGFDGMALRSRGGVVPDTFEISGCHDTYFVRAVIKTGRSC